MTEGKLSIRWMTETALMGGLALLTGGGPAQVTRTVTTQTTTTAPPPAIVDRPAVTTTTLEQVNTPAVRPTARGPVTSRSRAQQGGHGRDDRNPGTRIACRANDHSVADRNDQPSMKPFAESASNP